MKVIQLAPIERHYDDDQVGWRLFALCDDGSIWQLYMSSSGDDRWHSVPQPPGCEPLTATEEGGCARPP